MFSRTVPAILQSAGLRTTPVMPGFARGIHAFVRLRQDRQGTSPKAADFIRRNNVVRTPAARLLSGGFGPK